MFGFLAPITRPIRLACRLSGELRRPKFGGSWTLTKLNSQDPATWRDFRDGLATATRTVRKGGVTYVATAERYDPTDRAEKGLEALWGFALLITPFFFIGLLLIWSSMQDEPLKTRIEFTPIKSV